MFKKLKDKIAEEVKQSPLKSVQQLAQAVVSPSSSSVFEPSSSNDKFCIEEGDIEEDENRQEQAKPGGFTSVALTGQTTSPIRDQSQKHGFRSSSGSLMGEADNLFPKFEPQPTNFHVQSDWESASEVEDRYSQLEHINKESLYEAYRKVYNRYNRMKNKYHEVVTHYRQLEREKEKARTVLAETQDKALLRISELREQCLLEQQAKAHLEEALRNELEERDHIINTLKTKVQYLKSGDNTAAEGLNLTVVSREEGNLIDFTDNSSVSTVPMPCNASNFEEKISWFEEKVNSLKKLLSEETSKVDQLKSQLREAMGRNCDLKDGVEEKVENVEPSVLEEQTKNDLHKVLADLISKLSAEVQSLQKNAVSCSILKSMNDKANSELRPTDRTNEKGLIPGIVHDAQREDVDRYIAMARELEEKNRGLTMKLNEESTLSKELKEKLNSLNTIADTLRSRIKLSNENFGKNDAINCLITDVDHELIQEWNICFQNFLQTRCEITVLKDTRDDLEKELLRMKEENKKYENMSKELKEQNNKFKGDVENMQKDLKSYLDQLESMAKEKNELKMNNEKLEKQNKKLQDNLSRNQKVQSETHEDLQKIVDEKSNVETKLFSIESELQKTRSEYLLLQEVKQKMDDEMLTLRRENEEVMAEKESLNNKVNEMENKLKQVEEDYNLVLETRDGLDNQINTLTKLTEEFSSERNSTMCKISNLERDIEQKNIDITLLHGEREKLLHEIGDIKEKNDTINKEKLAISEKLCKLSKEFEQNKQDYVKSLESSRERSDEVISLKKERDELITEKNILESEIEKLNKDNEVLSSSNSKFIEMKEDLSKELSSVKEERNKLLLDIQSIQNKVLELDSASKSANEELLVVKREHADLTFEKCNLQKEILRLQACLESNNENYSSSSETITELSNELSSLKKERDELIKEKSTMEDLLKKLDHNLSISKEELSTLTEEYSKVTDKLQMLQKTHEDLIMLKQNEQSSVNEMKNELSEKEEMLRSVTEKNQQLNKDIEKLKDDYNNTDEECKSMKEKYNNAVAECEQNISVISSLKEIITKLQEENNHFKEESKHIYETKTLLDEERNAVSMLKGQLSSLSESLKKKCEETDMKDKEILCLKTSSEKLSGKINSLNSIIEKITQEKKVMFNALLANLDNVKIIKELQKNLYGFVKQFQVEVSKEINDINLMMGKDLLKYINDLLDHETCGDKFAENKCNSKGDIDLFNSNLKNLKALSNISDEEVLQVKVTPLKSTNCIVNESGSNMVKFSQMGHLEKLSESDNSYSYDPEAYLKKAISLMKSFTNLLNHNSVSCDYSDDVFVSENEKHIRFDEIDSKNLQKEIVAMESFITDCETKYNKTCVAIQQSNHIGYADEHGDTTEILLKQEIGLKNDVIKKLQSVIEEYEQKKDVDDSEFIYKQKVHMLEEENKSLTNKLKQLQETHELNVRNIVSEYEKRLEDIEEESNLYDFEKLGKEKNHVVNEMKEQIQNLQQDLEDRGDAFEKLYEEHQHSVKSFDEEIQQARSNHDKELREQDKKWRQCLDRRLAEEEARHQQELVSLNMQWNAERRELETARRLALNALESGSGSNDMLRIQVQALEMQLNELRSNRCEACDRKRKSEMGQDRRSRSIQDCTEMEYLRNILYEYMMGKEPLVLAKVLCALVKFDENQTKEIVSKEEHRITLFGQLGLL